MYFIFGFGLLPAGRYTIKIDALVIITVWESFSRSNTSPVCNPFLNYQTSKLSEYERIVNAGTRHKLVSIIQSSKKNLGIPGLD